MATLQPGNYVIKSFIEPRLAITLHRNNNQVGTIPWDDEAASFHVWAVRPAGPGRFFFQQTGAKKYIAPGPNGVTGSDTPYAWSLSSHGLFWEIQDPASKAVLTLPISGISKAQLTMKVYNHGQDQVWYF